MSFKKSKNKPFYKLYYVNQKYLKIKKTLINPSKIDFERVLSIFRCELDKIIPT